MNRPDDRQLGFLSLIAVITLIVAQLNTGGPRARAQAPAHSGAAASQEAQVVLKVVGEVPSPLKLTATELSRLPHQSLVAKAHDGKASRYEGIALIDLLQKAGLPTGKALRGNAVAIYVVVEAADGYRAVFALAEIDSSFTDRVILLADRRDGQPLTTHEGPLQIIVPGEKKQARWVRQVTALRIGRG